MPSITGLNGSSFDARGGNGLRGRDHVHVNAARTVCRLTRYFAAIPRPDNPPLESLRIADLRHP
ncbi:hypothetical protein Dvina_17320 [Dactylosporangium vinaceum]|uniref:Uncharacterized protein n=1 Tax=Dactylosporangium vinaceum TaxID=53362 RepID=A0ABV5M3I0_9ACTN|nr:hypothetical protein [Dactylosporangium vinaceum]UAB99670.1 hypothetical protein Dvina_17320 [Dactylosporangium vinaceum]